MRTGRILVAVALASVPVLARAEAKNKPSAITHKTGEVVFDFSAAVALAPGRGAADLRAPNAQVARVKAERTARTDAAKRLTAALAALSKDHLGCDKVPAPPKPLIDVADTAETESIDWSSDGSVALVLRVPFAALAPDDRPAAAAPLILVDGKARLSVFTSAGAACFPAPRYFDRLADARAAGSDLAAAKTTRKHAEAPRPAAVVKAE